MEYPVLDITATGANIKYLRKKNHLTVAQVAEFMGFESDQAVYKWQRGDSLPTLENFYALSVLFQTPMEKILVDCDRQRSEKVIDFPEEEIDYPTAG